MFNKKKLKKIENKIVELKLSLSTMQLLYDSITNRLNRKGGEKHQEIIDIRTKIDELERETESDSNLIADLKNNLGEKDKMIGSLREEVSEIKEVVKGFLKVSGCQVRMVRNENYMNAHSIKVTKIDNSSKKKI